jgi:hypothetical protein
MRKAYATSGSCGGGGSARATSNTKTGKKSAPSLTKTGKTSASKKKLSMQTTKVQKGSSGKKSAPSLTK